MFKKYYHVKYKGFRYIKNDDGERTDEEFLDEGRIFDISPIEIQKKLDLENPLFNVYIDSIITI